jgi:hypothetical protein
MSAWVELRADGIILDKRLSSVYLRQDLAGIIVLL